MSDQQTRIPLVFIDPPLGAIGGPPDSEKWFEEIKSRVIARARELYPHIEFHVYDVRDLEDVRELLKKEADSPGYMVFILNCITGLVRPIIYSGKPVILVSETYGGSGDYVLEYNRARSEGYPVIGISTRDPGDDRILAKIRLLETIDRLRNTRVLFIVTPSEEYLIQLEYPLSIDIYSSMKSMAAITGITPIILNGKEFVEKYYNRVDPSKAEELANKWINEAVENLEPDREEIVRAAKLYLAIKNAVGEYNADAVAIDCIVLHNIGVLDAWPCLGFMELWYDGIIPICEADPYSTLLLLIGKYLFNVHGFITDPAIDELEDEIIYYHCYAPTNPLGPGKTRCPYYITTAHLGIKHASIYVKLPVNTVITAAGFSPEDKVLTIHTARVVKTEFSQHACSNKLVGKTSARKIVEKWPWRSGWHRVVLYGDHREELKELATLLGLKVIEEDRGV
ncbi:MAG: hypothetical protein J7K21_05925 [Desulfurococcales archaeon]|nr:hypothetical protein [Desulfurococcales archaeon]